MAVIQASWPKPNAKKEYFRSRQSSLERGIHDYLLSVIFRRFNLSEQKIALLRELDLSTVLGCYCNLQKTLVTAKGQKYEIVESDLIVDQLKEKPEKHLASYQQFLDRLEGGDASLCRPNELLWRTSCRVLINYGRKNNLRIGRRKSLLSRIQNLKVDIPRSVIQDKNISLKLIAPFYDITLFEWDMHHCAIFGNNDDLLYFLAKNRTIYMIAFEDHKFLNDDNFIKIAYSNWPNLYSERLWANISSVDRLLTPLQRKNIRGAGNRYVVAPVNIDGVGVLYPNNSFDVSLSLPIKVKMELDNLTSQVNSNIRESSKIVPIAIKFLERIDSILGGD